MKYPKLEPIGCHYAGALDVKANVVGVIALAENSVGPEAYRPSDILTSLKGTTVHVNNTDAEGRLVLADAMTYTQQQYNVHTMVDVATLTGAIIIALGHNFCGMFTPSDKLATQLSDAGKATDEAVWRMPLSAEFTQVAESTSCFDMC